MQINTYILPVMIAMVILTIVTLCTSNAKKISIVRALAILSSVLMFIPTLFLFVKRIIYKDEVELGWTLLSWKMEIINENSNKDFMSLPLSLYVDIFDAWMLVVVNVVVLTMAILGHYIKTRQKWFYVFTFMLYLLSLIAIMSTQAWMLLLCLMLMAVVVFYMSGIWSKADHYHYITRFIFIQTIGFSSIGFGLFIMQFIVFNGGEQPLVLQQLTSYIETYSYINISQAGYRNLAILFILAGFACLMPAIGFHRPIRDLFKITHYPIMVGVVGLYLSLIAYMFKQIMYNLFIDYMSSLQPYVTLLCVVQIGYMAVHLWKVKKIKEWIGYLVLANVPIIYILLVSSLLVTVSFALLAIISFMLTMTLILSIMASLHERYREDKLDQLNGLFIVHPYLSSMLILALLAASGLPLFSHYFTVFHTFYAVYDVNGLIFVVCIVAIFLIAINLFLNMSKLFIKTESDGEVEQSRKQVRNIDLRFLELIPNIILIALVFVLGIYPSVFLQRIEQYVDTLLSYLNEYRDVSLWDTDFYFSLIMGDSISSHLQFAIASIAVIVLLGMCWLGSKQNQKMLHWVYWQASHFACVGLTILVVANVSQMRLVWIEIIFYGLSVSLIFVGTHFLLSRHMYRSGYEDAVHYEGMYFKNNFLYGTMSVLILAMIGLPFTPIGIMRLQFLAQLINERYVLLSFVVCLSFSFMLRPLWHWLATMTFPMVNGSLLNRQEQIEDWTWSTLEKRLVYGAIGINLLLLIIYILL